MESKRFQVYKSASKGERQGCPPNQDGISNFNQSFSRKKKKRRKKNGGLASNPHDTLKGKHRSRCEHDIFDCSRANLFTRTSWRANLEKHWKPLTPNIPRRRVSGNSPPGQ
jgi:hypothetical protein